MDGWGGLGERVQLEYMMYGGCQGDSGPGYDGPGSIALSHDGYSWNTDPDVPRAAVRMGDSGGHVLASDLVLFRRDRLTTNHTSNDPRVPAYQNVLWGDARVSSRTAGYYDDDPPDYHNYSIRSWQAWMTNSWYYFY